MVELSVGPGRVCLGYTIRELFQGQATISQMRSQPLNGILALGIRHPEVARTFPAEVLGYHGESISQAAAIAHPLPRRERSASVVT